MSVVGLDRAVLFRVATSERLERAVKVLPLGEAACGVRKPDWAVLVEDPRAPREPAQI